MNTDESNRQDNIDSPVKNPETSQNRESIVSAAGTINTVNKALQNTAQKYLTAAGIKVNLMDFEKKIHTQPLLYLAISAGLGFIVGGGMASKIGVAAIGLAGRKVGTETAMNIGRQVLRRSTEVAGARSNFA